MKEPRGFFVYRTVPFMGEPQTNGKLIDHSAAPILVACAACSTCATTHSLESLFYNQHLHCAAFF